MTFINLISLFLLFYLKKNALKDGLPAHFLKYFNYGMILSAVLIVLTGSGLPPEILFQLFSFLLVGGIIYFIVNTPELEKQKNLAIIPLPILIVQLFEFVIEKISPTIYETIENYIDAAGFFALIWAITMWVNHRKELKAIELEKLISKEKERQLLLAKERKDELERLISERTSEITIQKEELQHALEDLKSTQEQLIQQEKLASLGQLTAGIAHEIKNPLNFVNNFSELSQDLLGEIEDELEKIPESEQKDNILELLVDVKSNLEKIRHHGMRADGIVRSMLMHSRGGTGTMEPTDLNELVKEYANLAFHGMRANKNPINVEIKLDLDGNLPKLKLNSEDFSRVILNLCNNAFDAMREKLLSKNSNSTNYKAQLHISSKKLSNGIELIFADNGPGIPEDIQGKILQPFFTTKKRH
jgi:two-component system, NtrC family, sensor kinase